MKSALRGSAARALFTLEPGAPSRQKVQDSWELCDIQDWRKELDSIFFFCTGFCCRQLALLEGLSQPWESRAEMKSLKEIMKIAQSRVSTWANFSNQVRRPIAEECTFILYNTHNFS